MKLIGLFIAAFSFTFFSTVDNKVIDIENSTVVWNASKVTGKHSGTIKLLKGDLGFTDEVLTEGSFTIDMASIECTDLEGDSKGKLEGHLKSADFFGVEENPTASFVITKVTPRGMAGDYKVIGDITIKGMTKEIRFNTLLSDGKARATVTLDRSDYNVRYGSGSFFSNLGDKTIHDEFTLDIELAYTK